MSRMLAAAFTTSYASTTASWLPPAPPRACSILETEEVHVVMTDQRMPAMTGVEFLKHIRGEHPEATRLLFTGYADIRAVIEAINQGNVYRYINKPWDPDELQTIIREAVERYDLIVERRRLMEDLQTKNAQLEAVNTQLREANELKTNFIRVASHELRTPLTILLGMVKLAERLTNVEPPLKDWLPRIDSAAERLRHLIEQIIAMLTAGKFDKLGERESVNLSNVLRQAADDVRPFIELRHQELLLDFTGDLGNMRLDAEKIRDSINHLLLNAIKFTPDGGAISLLARRLDNQSLEIQVRDTGVGINDASRARLFEPFFTGFDVSRHSSGTFEFQRQGLGLGLSVVKAFVEMHGGTVAVESQVGGGTTFTISLPATPG